MQVLKPEFFKADFVKIMTWHLYFVPLLVRRETRGSSDLTKAAIGQVERLTRDDDVEKRAVSKSEHWKFFCKISTLDKWFTERVFHRDTYWHWNWNLCWSKLGYFGEFSILEKGGISKTKCIVVRRRRRRSGVLLRAKQRNKTQLKLKMQAWDKTWAHSS